MKFRSIALAFVGFTASCVLASDPAPRSTIDLKIDVTPEPEFPTALAQAGYIEGSAAAIIVVDETGQLRDHLLIDASHRLFGAELLRVIPQWRYTAPLKAGVPVTAARRVEVRFNASGAVISIFGHNAVLLRSPLVAQALHDKLRYQIASPRDLDQPLTATKVVPPQAPPPFSFLADKNGPSCFNSLSTRPVVCASPSRSAIRPNRSKATSSIPPTKR